MFKKLKALFKKKKPAKKPAPKAEVKKPLLKRPSAKKKVLREAYKILKEPHISEKATILSDENKYIFKIYPRANKVETKKAIEDVYGVKVKDVNIINVHRKRRILRGVEGFKPGFKKAIVTLEKGEKIEIIPR
jgi:large subunit ribosomal protein L23